MVHHVAQFRCWLTQALMGHLDYLDATFVAFSTLILQAAMECVPLMLCFPLTPCREMRKWFSLAMLTSRDTSRWTTRIFSTCVTFYYDLRRRWATCNQFLKLLDSSGLFQVCQGLWTSVQNWDYQRKITYGANWLHKYSEFCINYNICLTF